MKKIFTLILATSIYLNLTAQEVTNEATALFGKISYYNGEYNDFMTAASLQSKPVMLLFCRAGCHTCSSLKRGLQRADMGEYFDRYFFSYFVDVEKEKFKMFPLSEKYGVNATPYFVFLTPNGKVIYKGSLNPERDSLLEKCSQIVMRNSSYLKVANLLATAVTPEQQKELAQQFVNRFKDKLNKVSAKTFTEQLFLTANQKNYKVFNETFEALAKVYEITPKTTFNVDAVTASASNPQPKPTCGKRAAKWQKWMAE